MVEYRLPSQSPASSESASSQEAETPNGDHGYTIGLPENTSTMPAGEGDAGHLGPITPMRPLTLMGWPRLTQSPLPVPPPPGTYPLTPMAASSPASQEGISGGVPPTPTPPGAFPPISPYPNRIATAPRITDDVRTALVTFGLPEESPQLLPRQLQRPVGKPYSGPRVTMAPLGVPTSPQCQGVQRSWITWWHDGATQNFIPAIATEIVGGAEDTNWEDIMYLLHVTSHAHIVRLLDGSHLPKRDPRSGAFVQVNGQLMQKSATDLAQLAGWNEQQWKRQRKQWREKGIWSELDVMPGVFPHPFLVWERIDGKPLSMILRKRPEGVEEAFIWYFLLSILEALRCLHHGLPSRPRPDGNEWMAVIHNNINPDNIWLNRPLREDARYGTVKLGNFSRAVVLDRRALGSFESPLRQERFHPEGYQRRPQHEHYEAPELSWMIDTDPRIANLLQEAESSSHPSPTECFPIAGRSDIWSLGAVVIALMGGVWIDPEDTSLERWQKVSREKTFVLQTVRLYQMGGKRWDRSLLPPGYSTTLRAVLEKMLTFDPKKRIDALQAHALVKKEYEKWLAEQPPAKYSDIEDDAIDSNHDDSDGDDDPFTSTRPPRTGGGRSAPRRPPRGSGDDDNDDEDDVNNWRPIGRKPAQTPLRPHQHTSHRPSSIRKQNAGAQRDRTKYTYAGRLRPRASSTVSTTSGLVRAGAAFQRKDRRPDPSTASSAGPSDTPPSASSQRPASQRKPSSRGNPARPSSHPPSSASTTPYGFRAPRAVALATPGFSPTSSTSNSHSPTSPPPTRQTPARSHIDSHRAAPRAQHVRFASSSPGPPRSHARHTANPPQRPILRPHSALPPLFEPSVDDTSGESEPDVESLADEQPSRWMCAAQ